MPWSKSAWGADEHEQNQAMAALEHAGNYLRHELASRLNLRKVPELHFEPDHYPGRRHAGRNPAEKGEKKACVDRKSALKSNKLW